MGVRKGEQMYIGHIGGDWLFMLTKDEMYLMCSPDSCVWEYINTEQHWKNCLKAIIKELVVLYGRNDKEWLEYKVR